jgi:prephenate dehydrogenase
MSIFFRRCYAFNNMTIAIIGGTGGMGETLVRFFNSQNISTKPVGRKTKNPETILNHADVIIISVPSQSLKYAVDLLKGIDIKKKLIVTLGSCMIHDKKILKSLKAPVVHIHQLFGPQVYPFNGQNIIFSGAIKDTQAKKILSLFKKSGANVTTLSESKHDELMANTQALSQFSTIAMAKTLSESKFKQKDLENGSTVTFKMNSGLIKRITAQKSALWAFLQFENEFAGKVLDKHIKNVILMRKLAKKKDYKGFDKIFQKMAKFWK